MVAIFLSLFTFIAHDAQHSLPCVRAGLIMASYAFALSLRRIFGSYTNTVNYLQLDHAACTRRSTSLSMVPSGSITDPMYLKWSTFLISYPFSFICNEFPLLTDVLQSWCSVLATLFFRPLLHSVLCIIAMSPAHSISHGSSNSTY